MHVHRTLLRKLVELWQPQTRRFAHSPLAEMILFDCEAWPSIHYGFMDLFILAYSS